MQTPPQSVSVSVPLIMPSVQLASAQVPPLQRSLRQSRSLRQVPPGAQPPQLPPQSMSVSSPFWLASLQVGSAHLSPMHSVFSQTSRSPSNCRSCCTSRTYRLNKWSMPGFRTLEGEPVHRRRHPLRLRSTDWHHSRCRKRRCHQNWNSRPVL